MQNKKISLVVPVYNEEENLENFLNEVKKIQVFDEILVVDNNSTDKSKEIIQNSNVTYLFEKIQGYGAALYTGLKNCKNDLICLIEPDGSFDPKEIENFIPYLNDYDCVLARVLTFDIHPQDFVRTTFALHLKSSSTVCAYPVHRHNFHL